LFDLLVGQAGQDPWCVLGALAWRCNASKEWQLSVIFRFREFSNTHFHEIVSSFFFVLKKNIGVWRYERYARYESAYSEYRPVKNSIIM
jgi:hypothetical protein